MRLQRNHGRRSGLTPDEHRSLQVEPSDGENRPGALPTCCLELMQIPGCIDSPMIAVVCDLILNVDQNSAAIPEPAIEYHDNAGFLRNDGMSVAVQSNSSREPQASVLRSVSAILSASPASGPSVASAGRRIRILMMPARCVVSLRSSKTYGKLCFGKCSCSIPATDIRCRSRFRSRGAECCSSGDSSNCNKNTHFAKYLALNFCIANPQIAACSNFPDGFAHQQESRH